MAPDAQDPHGEGRHREAGTSPVAGEVGPEAPEQVRLITVPASVRTADLSVGARAVRGLLLLVVVGALALGVRWWWVQQHASAVPVEAEGTWSQAEPGAGEDSASEADPAAVSAGPEEGEKMGNETEAGGPGDSPEQDLVVHVVGEVHDPGVVRLAAGSRVVDAVQGAGGLTDQADAGSVNLARAVLDGEQVWVGAPGEQPPAWVGVAGAMPGSTEGGAGEPGSGDVAPLDLNTATQPQLEELPGVGPVTAERILAWRTEHGQFTGTDELLEVSGIGDRTLEQLEPLVRVGG